MDFQEMVSRAGEAADVKRVYGEPYEKDGATVIPVARISARGGSGAARGGEHSGGVCEGLANGGRPTRPSRPRPPLPP